MTLEILISTLDEGISNVASMLLPEHDGIGYVVSWQHSDGKNHEAPHELMRSDVRVCHLSGRGLSRNRNNSIENARADVCLIADDDCRYSLEQLQQVVATFEYHRDVDVATFMYSGEGNVKHYPSHQCNLSVFPKGYFVSSIEIAFRRQSVQGNVWFNEHFGLGTEPFHCGEEHLFINDALQQGLTCHFFPITIVHDQQPLEFLNRSVDPGTLMAHGAHLQIFHSGTKLLRAVLKAYRLQRDERVPFLFGLRHIIKGMNHMKRNPEILKNKRKTMQQT